MYTDQFTGCNYTLALVSSSPLWIVNFWIPKSGVDGGGVYYNISMFNRLLCICTGYIPEHLGQFLMLSYPMPGTEGTNMFDYQHNYNDYKNYLYFNHFLNRRCCLLNRFLLIDTRGIQLIELRRIMRLNCNVHSDSTLTVAHLAAAVWAKIFHNNGDIAVWLTVFVFSYSLVCSTAHLRRALLM